MASRSSSQQTSDFSFFNTLCGGTQDSQPDFFYFNFSGHSGKFILDKVDAAQHLVVRQVDGSEKLRIEPIGTGTAGWTITTDDGHQYSFEKAEYTKTYSHDYGSGGMNDYIPNSTFISSWYLTRILAPDGDVVTFSYSPTQSSTPMLASEQQDNYIPGEHDASAPELQDMASQPSYTHTLTTGWILSTITTATGVVNFATATRTDIGTNTEDDEPLLPGRLIKGFTVTDATGARIVKYVDFAQSYFGSTTTNPAPSATTFAILRLRLDGITERGTGGPSLTHTFDYIVTSQALPNKNSANKDLLGYFNGQNNTIVTGAGIPSCLPEISVLGPVSRTTKIIPGAHRAPDNGFAQTAVLKQINYPTGGYTRFEYELHRYTSITGQDLGGAGLRVLRMASATAPGQAEKIKHFRYLRSDGAGGLTTVSSGRSMSKFLYARIYSVYYTGVIPSATYWKLFRTSFNEWAMGAAAQGEPYGYDLVTALEGENGENGKTEYYCSNQEETPPSGDYFTIGVPNKIPTTNGLLLKQIVYKQQNGKYFPVTQTDNCYFTGAPDSRLCNSGLADDSYLVKGAVVINGCQTGGGSAFWGAGVRYYDIDTYWTRLVSTTDKVFDQQNPAHVLQTVTAMQYRATHRQVVKIEKQLPEGITLRTYTTYAADYPSLTTGPVQAMANGLHMHSLPIESYTTTTHGTGPEMVTGGQLVAYQFANTGLTAVKPQQISTLLLAQPVNLSAFTVSTPALQVDSRYALQSAFTYDPATSNVLTARQADNALVSYQWTRTQQLPAAVFVAASRQAPQAADQALGNEASYLGFEHAAAADANAETDYWNHVGIHRGSNYIVGPGHTGSAAYRVGEAVANTTIPGPARTFSPDGQTRRFRLSAWVKTEGSSFAANAGHLTLAVSRGSNNTAVPNAFRETLFGDTQGEWRYQEVLVDLADTWKQLGLAPGSNGERLKVTASVSNVGQATGNPVGFWIDDIRFEPVDAQTTTTTYDEATRSATSASDANNQPTYYEYDGLQRLTRVRDRLGKLLKQYTYHYQR